MLNYIYFCYFSFFIFFLFLFFLIFHKIWLLEKFGINHDNLSKNENNELDKEQDSIKYDTKSPGEEIQTRKRNETRINNPSFNQGVNLFFKSNEQLIDFLSQAKTICDDYEKVICFLRNKLKECSSFNNLSVSESQPETNFLIDVSISNYFIKKLEEISKNATPDFNVLNTVYSEKITELFFENEKLDSQLKAFDKS